MRNSHSHLQTLHAQRTKYARNSKLLAVLHKHWKYIPKHKPHEITKTLSVPINNVQQNYPPSFQSAKQSTTQPPLMKEWTDGRTNKRMKDSWYNFLQFTSNYVCISVMLVAKGPQKHPRSRIIKYVSVWVLYLVRTYICTYVRTYVCVWCMYVSYFVDFNVQQKFTRTQNSSTYMLLIQTDIHTKHFFPFENCFYGYMYVSMLDLDLYYSG